MMENTDRYTILPDERPEEGEYDLTLSESAFFSQLEKSLKKCAYRPDAGIFPYPGKGTAAVVCI